MVGVGAIVGVAGVVARAVAWAATVPPDEPFPPVDQDPDEIRIEACKLVSDDPSRCVPATQPPDTAPARGSSGGTDLSFLSLLLWLLLIAGVVAIVWLLLRRTGVIGRGKGTKAADSDDDDAADEVISDVAVFVDRSREPFDWRKEADAHRRAGRYRDALRCRYRALVGDMARRGLIDEIPGRTTGEHRLQVHSVVPEVAAAFDAAAELFDGAWYGHFDVDERDDDRFVQLERDMLARVVGARSGEHGR